MDRTDDRGKGEPETGDAYIHTVRVGWADCDPARIAYTGRIPCFALEAIDAWWADKVGFGWYRLNLDRNLPRPSSIWRSISAHP